MGNCSSATTDSTIHVGQAPHHLSSIARRTVKFHDFQSLSKIIGVCMHSPTFLCHGHEWYLSIYPGGIRPEDDGTRHEFVSLLLCFASRGFKTAVKAKQTFSVKPAIPRSSTCNFGYFGTGKTFSGWNKWINREYLIANLLTADGTLSIDIEMQVYDSMPWSLDEWKPHSRVTSRLLKALETGEDSDLSFTIGDQTIKAHRFLLRWQAPTLAALIPEDSQVISIDNVPKPEHFRSMLQYVYTEDASIATTASSDLQESQELLLIATRFGIYKLKILLENAIVTKYLSRATAIDLLLFADTHGCPILYEASMSCILQDFQTFVSQKTKWKELEKSNKVLNAILKEQNSRRKNAIIAVGTFGALYAELEAVGKFDQDGTRDELKERLERK